jgi:protoheme IX farnesyltransferase
MKSTTAPSQTALSQDSQSLLSVYCELTKIRLSVMVVITTAVGFVMASTLGIDWMRMFWTVLGTLCCACAAAALNQVAEHSRDAAMDRTKNRPIPAGHISSIHAFIVGVLLSYVGVAIVSFGASVGAAGLALLTILIYVLIYTPLKTRTSFNTIVGAIVGAIPPLIGWVAAAGSIGRGGIILGGILFIWQLPHFLALAWMYKDDYEQGGFKMLPSLDASGELTARASVVTSLCLVPLALFMSVSGSTSILFAVVGSILGLWVTARSITFWRTRDRLSAKRLFFATIIYLPILLVFMVIDRQTVQWIEMGS